MTSPALWHSPTGSRPAPTARMPRRIWLRNMLTPRSVAPRCSKPWIAIGRGELAGEHDVTVGPPCRGPTFGLADMPKLDEHCVRVVLGRDPAAHHRAT